MRPLPALAMRDSAIVITTLALWWVSRQLDAAASDWAAAVAVLVGGLTAVCGFILHEWGHLLGAWLSRSRVHLAETALAVFLFRFDSDLNNRRQFLWMSNGGFIVSGLLVALLIIALTPTRLADQIALGLTLLGVIATVLLEFPPAWRVFRGGPIPSGAVYVSKP
ncbi:MAG: hypothetical protein ACRETN_03420 [Nevskiales bacterium]